MTPVKLLCLSSKCKAIVDKATESLGNDLAGHSIIDLVADNLPNEPLETLVDALVVAGFVARLPHRVECAWCGKVLKLGRTPVSHGICPKCRDGLKKEMETTK